MNHSDWPERLWVGAGIECRVNMGLAGEFPGKRFIGYTFRECENSPEMEYVRKDLYNDSLELEDALRHHYNNEAFYRDLLVQVANAVGAMAFTDRDGTVHKEPLLSDLPRIVSAFANNRVMPDVVRAMRDACEHHTPAEETAYYEHREILEAVDGYYGGLRDWRAFNDKRKDHALGWSRYEKLRRLNATQFQELFNRAITEDLRFDDLVDDLPDHRGNK